MIYGVGIDLVDVERVARLLDRHGARARLRIFTDDEWRRCQASGSEVLCLAARLAAKEAFSKALGTGIAQGVRWRDIEVTRAAGSRPTLRLHGEARRLLDERCPGARLHVSLTHTATSSAAVVIIEGAALPDPSIGVDPTAA